MAQERAEGDSPRRFGTIAVKKGFITNEQLIKALKIQEVEDRDGKMHRFIGLILYDERVMSIEQVNKVHKSLSPPLYEL